MRQFLALGVVLATATAVSAAPIEVTFIAVRDQEVAPASDGLSAASERERLFVRMVYDSAAAPVPASFGEQDYIHFAMELLTVAVVGGSGLVEYAVDGRPLSVVLEDGPQNAGMYISNEFIGRQPGGPEVQAMDEPDFEPSGLIGVVGEATLPSIGTQHVTISFTSDYMNLPETHPPLVSDWNAFLAADDAFGHLVLRQPTDRPFLTDMLDRPIVYIIELESVIAIPEPASLAFAAPALALLLRRRRA